jgi:hypothetical protein
MVGGTLIRRGETCQSLRTVRKAVGYRVGFREKYPTYETVRRFYEDLMKAQRISTRTSHLMRITTILNYDKMQLIPGCEPVSAQSIVRPQQ